MSDTNNYSRNLICVKYPGIVNNADKAIETLGGIKSISKGLSSRIRRLEIRFRPKDPYCKVVSSNIHTTPGVLLKIRVKKKKQGCSSGGEVVATEVLGIIRQSFNFETLADFEYLPLVPKDEENPTSGLRCILDELVPNGFPDVEWMNSQVPYFFVPPVFSRMSTPQGYVFNYSISDREKEVDTKNIIGRYRKARTRHAIYVNFNHTDPVPTEPNKMAVDALSADCKELEIIREYFEKKPIRSKNELFNISKLSDIQLKTLLPCVAYYYLNGPWRSLWVRFGYDPRKDPQSRLFQCMDYRVRSTGGLKSLVKGNRQDSYNPFKERCKNYHSKIFQQNHEEGDKPKITEEDQIASFMFQPGTLPAQRQMFYQYCHLKVPEIEEMLARLGEVLPGALCHERRGWLPAGFHDQCREILNAHINAFARERFNQAIQSTSNSDVVTEKDDDDEKSNNLNDDDIEEGNEALSEFEYDEEDDDNVFQENETEIELNNAIVE